MDTISRDASVPLLRFCERSDTPICLGVYLRVKYGCWDELAIMEVRPEWYDGAYDYFIDRQAACWLSKYKPLPTSFDRAKAAETSLQDSERSCKLTNDRLSKFLLGGPYEPEDERILNVIAEIRNDIVRTIGNVPPKPDFRFGPGATLSDKGELVSIPHKICSTMTITKSALWLIPELALTAWGRYGQKCFEIVDSNRFTTVQKNAKTDRGIEIQPSVNVSAQLGYGRHIRNCLKRRGLDLRSAAREVHQVLAQKGSRDGSLATIDLKTASDTTCSNLVKLLFPPEWYTVLKSLTTSRLSVGQRTLRLERFSSMGNGFTFELETLIFWAIARAVSQKPAAVKVFGDDIIVASEDVRSVIAAYRYFGFAINQTKSFTSGRFRESCGGDFFDGLNVRPFYLKDEPREPQHYISYANGVRRAANNIGGIRYTTFHSSWLHIQDCIPSSIRACRGPEYFGDLLLHDDPEYYNLRVRDGIEQFVVYRPNRISGFGWRRFCGSTQLAAALYGCRLVQVGPDARITGVPIRDGVLSYTVTRIPS